MNRIIQLILFSILVIIISVFYNKYFKKNHKAETNDTLSITSSSIQEEDDLTNQKENNIIKNLKYEISIRENNDYQIMSEVSELTYEDGSELILMTKVTAILTDENNNSVIITSDKARYNNTNYNTSFEGNVKINYLNNIILAENMFLDFKENSISVKNNVKYNGSLGNLEADNIKINLITKKIDVFMNNTNENIVITSSK
ncbi:MAG: LPS export ABC transporter periplasmic protein LptC [Candidatus Pelagibacter sp.]